MKATVTCANCGRIVVVDDATFLNGRAFCSKICKEQFFLKK